MGGYNEKVLDMPEKREFAAGRGQPSQFNLSEKIRIHENAGEVHFHDDAKNLKVAVPTHEFHLKWGKFDSEHGGTIRFVDRSRGTMAHITSVLQVTSNPNEWELGADITITKLKILPALAALQDFAESK